MRDSTENTLFDSNMVDAGPVERLAGLLNSVLVKAHIRKAGSPRTPRQRYEAALDSSAVTRAQRETAMEHAAATPELRDGRDRADQAIERHLEGLAPDELQGRTGS